jgi:hypothetical protein
MKVNAKVVGYSADPGMDKTLVNIIVEFSGPTESSQSSCQTRATKPHSKNKALQKRRTWPCNLQPTGSSLTEARGRHAWPASSTGNCACALHVKRV